MRLNILLVAALAIPVMACAQNPVANSPTPAPSAASSAESAAPVETATTEAAATEATPAPVEPAPEEPTPAAAPAAAPGTTVVVITEASAPASEAPEEPVGPIVLPAKGLTRSEVEKNFGAPNVKNPTVGGTSPQQPPITRWDYTGFSVIFEYDHVVDAVQRNNPAPIQVFDGLAGGPSQPIAP